MINIVITNIDQVSTIWLTSVLAKSGALTHGNVESFELGTGKGNWSTNANVLVKYTDNAKGLLPKRLFLKKVDTDLGDGESFGDSEVTYYTQDYADINNAPLLRCYSASYSKELGQYHILLDDVSETHIESAEKEPTLEYGLALAEGLAVLHARWWGADQLAEAGASMPNSSFIRQFVDIAALGVEHILSQFSHELKPHWRDNLHEIYAKHPQAIMKRTDDLNGFTIIHGDVGSANILVPRQGNYPVYIIDRQPFNWSLTIWLGVYDIAYAIVLDWDIKTRRQHEITILKRYHEQLIKNGVYNYTWEQLYNDYKLCVVMAVYIATEYFRGGVNGRWTHIWLSMLQRALTACDDLDCHAIWRENIY
jgi:hypothetical protein